MGWVAVEVGGGMGCWLSTSFNLQEVTIYLQAMRENNFLSVFVSQRFFLQLISRYNILITIDFMKKVRIQSLTGNSYNRQGQHLKKKQQLKGNS